jgi:hypothetical protein
MERRDSIENALVGGIGPAGLNMLNEGSLRANNTSLLALPVRKRENIDLDWRFYLGDIAGAEKPYKDSNWRRLNVPHDMTGA